MRGNAGALAIAPLIAVAGCQVERGELAARPASEMHALLLECAGGDVDACARGGLAAWRNEDRDAETAFTHLGCDGGHAPSCTRAALLLAKRDPEASLELRWRAVTMSAASCGESDLGCAEVIAEMRKSSFTLTERDPARVAELLEPACGERDPHACEMRARALERLCRRGCRPAHRDAALEARARAIEGFEAGCAGQPIDCLRLASIYEWGTGGAPRRRDRAIAIVERSCAAGHEFSCLRLAQLLVRGRAAEPGPDLERAVGLYRRLCDSAPSSIDRRLACHNLGQLYRRGIGVPVDLGEAARYAERACALGYQPDCAKSRDR